MQGAQPSQCMLILTSLGPTPTALSREGRGMTLHVRSLFQSGKMLDEDNLVLTSALLLL